LCYEKIAILDGQVYIGEHEKYVWSLSRKTSTT
jgi:hypothetical protein